jgi:hypothetical protein
MAFRISTSATGETLTAYWFGAEPAARDWRVDEVLDYLDAADPEIAAWSAAATALVAEVEAATAEFAPAREAYLRRRRWQRRRYATAEAAYRARIRAAAMAYAPVRAAVEQRLAQAAAVLWDKARAAYADQERRHAEGRARLAAWEERQAVADRPLPGGQTPLELADRSEEAPALPLEVRDVVGDVGSWWAGVVAAARNERALTAAVQKVASTVTATAAALEEAGRPGLTAVKDKPYEVLDGWWVEFDWSDLPSAEPLRTPPDMPVSHRLAGDWEYDLYLPDRVLLTPSHWPGYGLATVTEQVLGNGRVRHHSWSIWDIETFGARLFPTTMTYRERYGDYHARLETRLPRHADPAAYVPYVEAVAQRAVAAFTALEATGGAAAGSTR